MWEDQRKPPPRGGIAGKPRIEPLPSGTLLARVHPLGRGACEFSHDVPTTPGGGRFDTYDDAFGHLYAADGLEGAVAETLVRDVPLADPGPREIPFTRLRGRAFSFLRTTRDLRLMVLRGPHPSTFGQGAWLTKCEREDYPLTREWGRALRERVSNAAGMVWHPRHDEEALAYVLWSDRAAGALEPGGPPLPIDSAEGLAAVRKVLLERHNAVVLR